MAPAAATQLPDLWDDARAASLDEPGLLLYRSNLLGGDLRITNFGGGNTSAQVDAPDPLTGEMVSLEAAAISPPTRRRNRPAHHQRRRRQRGLLHPLGFATLQVRFGKTPCPP